MPKDIKPQVTLASPARKSVPEDSDSHLERVMVGAVIDDLIRTLRVVPQEEGTEGVDLCVFLKPV